MILVNQAGFREMKKNQLRTVKEAGQWNCILILLEPASRLELLTC